MRQQDLNSVKKQWLGSNRNIPIPIEARELEQLAGNGTFVCWRIVAPWPHHAEILLRRLRIMEMYFQDVKWEAS